MNKNQSLTAVKILSILAFILMVTTNALANILPINGQNTGEISNRFPSLFTPAALTFSVWGLIYLFLLFYTVYQTGLIGKRTQSFQKAIRQIGLPYIISCIANAAWILCWHYNLMIPSLIVMVILLVTLIFIYLRIKSSIGVGKTLGEKWFISVPFSFYLAWISVATIANATAALVKMSWDGGGISPQIWTVAVIAVAIAITLIVQRKYHDYAYSLVVIWALIGILIQHMGTFNGQYIGIIAMVSIGMLILIADLFYSAFLVKKPKNGRKSKNKKRR